MYSKKVLGNGLRSLVVPVKDAKTVTILILFGVGSRYETPELNGISHFLEHLFFKGTKKYPTTLEISKVLDGVGAEYNAFTGKDQTGYYVKVDVKHADLAFDILSEMLLNPLFPEEEIERERGVIIEEINMYEDNPLMYVEDIYEKTLYDNNSLGQLIIGPRENIRRLSRDQIINYRKKHYRGDNVVVAVAGGVDESAHDKVEQYFGAVPGEPREYAKGEFDFDSADVEKNEIKTVLWQKPIEQINLGLGVHAYSYQHKDAHALKLLSVILGGNMSSRLFIHVRERQGLCYFIRAGINMYQDTGNLYIQAGLDKTRIEDAVRSICEQLRKMRDEKVSDEELQRAQSYVQGKMALSLEDTSSLAEFFVRRELLTNEIVEPDDLVAKYNAVTVEDIQRVAQDILKKDALTLAMIGPDDVEQKVKDILDACL